MSQTQKLAWVAAQWRGMKTTTRMQAGQGVRKSHRHHRKTGHHRKVRRSPRRKMRGGDIAAAMEGGSLAEAVPMVGGRLMPQPMLGAANQSGSGLRGHLLNGGGIIGSALGGLAGSFLPF